MGLTKRSFIMDNKKLNEWKETVRDYVLYGPVKDKQKLYSCFKNRIPPVINNREYEHAILWLSKTLGY